jgi:hypothetical protein
MNLFWRIDMSPLMQDARAVPGAHLPGPGRAWMPLDAVARAWARLLRWHAAGRARRAAARAALAQARVMDAARQACAVEGACVEFDVLEFGGRRYGAVYVDGKLNCLLPGMERL